MRLHISWKTKVSKIMAALSLCIPPPLDCHHFGGQGRLFTSPGERRPLPSRWFGPTSTPNRLFRPHLKEFWYITQFYYYLIIEIIRQNFPFLFLKYPK